jgi:hypothetical protein
VADQPRSLAMGMTATDMLTCAVAVCATVRVVSGDRYAAQLLSRKPDAAPRLEAAAACTSPSPATALVLHQARRDRLAGDEKLPTVAVTTCCPPHGAS